MRRTWLFPCLSTQPVLFCFFVYSYSQSVYLLVDYGGVLYILSAVRAMAARCKLPFALHQDLKCSIIAHIRPSLIMASLGPRTQD